MNLYAKNLFEVKYQFLINKHKTARLNQSNDCKAFIEYLTNMDGIFENNGEYNPNKERKNLIVFDDMIADM